VTAIKGGQESEKSDEVCATPSGGGDGGPIFSDVPASHPYYTPSCTWPT